MMNSPQSVKNIESNKFNFKSQIEHYLAHWIWFLIGLLVTFFAAFLFLRYSIPQYKANTLILVKDELKGHMTSELEAFRELGLIGDIKDNVDNEIEVLKSRTLIESAVRTLQLNVSYFGLGRVKSEEIYDESPIQIVFLKTTKEYNKNAHQYSVKYLNKNQFTFLDHFEQKIGDFKFGETISIDNVEVIVTNINPQASDYSIGILITPVEDLVAYFKAKLNVAVVGKNTSVIELSLVDPVSSKAEDFLNTLVESYNTDAIQDKKFVAENTSKFIEERLRIIANELKGVEKDVENFKKENHVTDIVSEAGLFLENASAFERKKLKWKHKLKLLNLY